LARLAREAFSGRRGLRRAFRRIALRLGARTKSGLRWQGKVFRSRGEEEGRWGWQEAGWASEGWATEGWYRRAGRRRSGRWRRMGQQPPPWHVASAGDADAAYLGKAAV
jgi:hypothetical protein